MSAKETIEKLQNARIITALVTPFKENGQINFGAFPKLIEDLLANQFLLEKVCCNKESLQVPHRCNQVQQLL